MHHGAGTALGACELVYVRGLYVYNGLSMCVRVDLGFLLLTFPTPLQPTTRMLRADSWFIGCGGW